MEIPFTKMHGIGNDFVMIDAYVPRDRYLADSAREHSQFLCDRHFGIGGDGVIIVLPSPTPDAQFEMVMYNPDGSLSEMCGNGIRCFAKYVVDRCYTKESQQRILTGRGVLITDTSVGSGMVTVDMGTPILARSDVPVNLPGPPDKPVIGEELTVDGRKFAVTCVSMGNPHCVVFLDHDPDELNLNEIGPMFESHLVFPKRINTEFIQILSDTEYKMRVWERGAAETLACGTGACAVAVAGILNGKFRSRVTGHLAGGDLILEWDGHGSVMMTGPAQEVFNGTIVV
jgi:diaminopimelate epimerase